MTENTLSAASLFEPAHQLNRLTEVRSPLYLLRARQTGQWGLAGAEEQNLLSSIDPQEISHIGTLPAIYPEWLGSQSFLARHQTRFPYIVGEMANGIATAEMVIAAVNAGMMGFFGAAGLVPERVEASIHKIQQALTPQQINWGANLIHSPNEPAIEAAVVALYLKLGVRRVSASAYMSLSPHIVHYACKGLRTDPQGRIIRQNYILAKISRAEVAQQFMSPAPANILQSLLEQGLITQQEAQLAAHIPVATDFTVESDSGGHTDNRPLGSLFPRIQMLRETLQAKYRYPEPIHLGAAGGLGSPSAVAAAFAMGADYVLTGSINQSAVEAGLCEAGRAMLAKADIADVTMAPAADMFELGVKLQVLKRGSLFAPRASKLYELYTRYDSIEAIPDKEKAQLEQQIFKCSLAEIWAQTERYFSARDHSQVERALRDAKHKMALIFRWYLGQSSRWAIQGEPTRCADYQIWCGPAMGAFNEWVKGSSLDAIENRTVAQIGLNLMEGAAVMSRAQQCRSMGMPLPTAAFTFKPRILK